MIRSTMKYLALSCAVMALAAFAGSANAASATATVPMTMAAVAPTCTVVNGNPNITLPVGTPGISTAAYMTANTYTTAGVLTTTKTNASLNQTATITCSIASTPITSISVTPGASAKLAGGASGIQLLVDTATTPNVAGTTNSVTGWYLGAELVSVNGAAAAFAFATSAGVAAPYTTSFNTGSIVAPATTSTGVFIWRPVMNAGTNSVMGTPNGGSFNGSYLLTVNY